MSSEFPFRNGLNHQVHSDLKPPVSSWAECPGPPGTNLGAGAPDLLWRAVPMIDPAGRDLGQEVGRLLRHALAGARHREHLGDRRRVEQEGRGCWRVGW